MNVVCIVLIATQIPMIIFSCIQIYENAKRIKELDFKLAALRLEIRTKKLERLTEELHDKP